MKKGFKFYTVWVGHKTGVFNNWPECELATKGYSGMRYKGFKTLEEANAAFEQGYYSFYGIKPTSEALNEPQEQVINSLDNPGCDEEAPF